MQADPVYDDVVSEVKAFLEERLAFAVARRDPRGARLPRPGHRLRQDGRAQLRARARGSTSSSRSGRPVLVGFSRKSSLGRIMGDPEATTGTAAASVGAAVAAFERGATILRVHDVREHVEALRAAQAVAGRRVKIELRGLELFGHHGVTEEERERGQRFVYDVELEVGERGANDRIEDAVDYREVAATVRRGRTTAASRCSRRSPPRSRTRWSSSFPVERVTVRVRKPEVRPAGHRRSSSRAGRRSSAP